MRPTVVLFVACASLLAAQAVAQTAQTAPSPDLNTIARGTTTEVLVDVVVLDKHGKPVKNLKAADIQLMEDDVKQDITSFRFVSPAEPAKGSNAAKAAPVVSAGPRSLRSVNLVCLVFHNLDPLSRIAAIDAVREFLKTDMPPDTYIGIFRLDDVLAPIFPFTARKDEVGNAVGNTFAMRSMDFNEASLAVLTANPTKVTLTTVTDTTAHTSTTTMSVTGGELSNSSVAGAEVSTDIGASAMRGAQITENRDFSHLTGMRETDKVLNMINQFAKLPGRKMVMLFSTGLSTTGDPDRFQQMITKALAADITFYPIDVTGMRENSTA